MVSHDLYKTLTQRVSNSMIVLSLTEITTYSALLQRCSYVDYRIFDTTINIAIFSHNKDTILVFLTPLLVLMKVHFLNVEYSNVEY